MDVGRPSPLRAAHFLQAGALNCTAEKHLCQQAWLRLFLSAPFSPFKGQSFISEEAVTFRENYIRKQKCHAPFTLGVNQGIKFLNPDMFLFALDWDVTSCSGSNLDLAWNCESNEPFPPELLSIRVFDHSHRNGTGARLHPQTTLGCPYQLVSAQQGEAKGERN